MANSAATGLLITAGLCFAGSLALLFSGNDDSAEIVGAYCATLVLCAAFAVVAEPAI